MYQQSNKEIFVGSGLCEVAGCLGLGNSENDVHNFEIFFSLVILLYTYLGTCT